MCKMELPELGLTLEEETGGVRVTQNSKSYLAGNWKLTDEVTAMIELSISNDFNNL